MSAPYTTNGSIDHVGTLIFRTPGVYSAKSWSIKGNLVLEQPGHYVIRSTDNSVLGGIDLVGNIIGPSTGQATIRADGNYNFVGTVANNVSAVTTDPVPPAPVANPPLVNMSCRIVLASGQTLSTGFVIGGTTPKKVLLRAVGPALAVLGVQGAMANPAITVYKGQTVIGSNDDWPSSLTATFTATSAFSLTPGSKDAALALTLDPGAYTAAVRGSGATDAGDVLLELYYVQ